MILLVEDNEDDAFAFRWALKKAQINRPLFVATDGKQAIEYLAGEGSFSDRSAHPLPSLVFLDLKLPYFTGWDVLTWVRSNMPSCPFDVVILSGSDEARDHERARELGAADYLVKPATPEQLARLAR